MFEVEKYWQGKGKVCGRKNHSHVCIVNKTLKLALACANKTLEIPDYLLNIKC
jgi:hypothetical protein